MGRPPKQQAVQEEPKAPAVEEKNEEKDPEVIGNGISGETADGTPPAAPDAQAPKEKEEEKPSEATFTPEQVKAMIDQAVAEAVRNVQTPTIVQVAGETERVEFIWQAPVSDENLYEIGPGGMYGRVTGKTGRFSVPKSQLSSVMDSLFRLLMEKRWIIVLSGLTDEERKIYNVDYQEGELLDATVFAKLAQLGSELLDIYPTLCQGHREMVQKQCYEAYVQGTSQLSREDVTRLKDMSHALGEDNNAFQKIIEQMNAADAN